MIKESELRSGVFGFSNENVKSYLSLYNFDNAKILSIVGSGDQYFTSILGGAKEVELYDINRNSYDYFVFKYTSILVLSYEEFANLFISSKLNNYNLYNKVSKYLPSDVKNRLNNFVKEYYFLNSLLSDSYRDYSKLDRFIPYLTKDNYYLLQSLLKERDLPQVYFYDLVNMPEIVKDNYYDIVLTSNIYDWIKISPKKYYKLLSRLNSPEIQAYYTWKIYEGEGYFNEIAGMEENGFTVDYVDSVIKFGEKDKVLTLRRNI